LFLVLFAILGISATSFDATLSKDDRKFVIKHLKQTQKGFLKSVKGLSEAQLNFKVTPEKWSVKECLQHLTLAEAGLWMWVDGALKAPANADKRAGIKMSDDDMLKGVSNRSNKVQAPDNFLPKNAKWSTMELTLSAFKEERGKLINFIKNTSDDMRNHVVTETPFGPIDSYKIVLLISAHTNLHMQQINEVKVNPDFPKK
jgi:hypothetical protein